MSPETFTAAHQSHRRHYGLASLAPRPGVIQALAALRRQGYRLGLISDCSHEIPDTWADSAFAPLFHPTVFSCTARAKKPDPALFHAACRTLDVAPAHCLFIGDGDSHELTAARQIGMDAILLCAPHERDMVMARPDAQAWDGQMIAHVAELVEQL